MTPEEAYEHCMAALDADDLPEAQFWLTVLQVLGAELEEQEVARGLRTMDVYLAAQTWTWE